jgi:hypothetical protein
MMRAVGSSFETAMNGGFIFIYTGQQPASANDAATGTLLATIAVDDGAVGLTFDDGAVAGEIIKAAAENWTGSGVAAGIAGWFRFGALDTNKATTQTTSAASSTTHERFDGAIAASGAELNTSNTNIAVGAIQTVNTFTITLPASA